MRHLHVVRARYELGPDATTRGVLGRLKEMVRYILRAHPEAERVSRDILRLDTSELLLEAVAHAFHGLDADRIDLRADGHMGHEQSGSATHVVPELAGVA